MKPRDLIEVQKEVAAIRDRLGEPIDAKIKDLVVGLRRWGVKTTMSCQGHWRGMPFPWVTISQESSLILFELLAVWNAPNMPDRPNRGRDAWNQSPWVVQPIFGDELRVMPRQQGWWRLGGLQKDAIAFGKFLQNLPDDFFGGEKE